MFETEVDLWKVALTTRQRDGNGFSSPTWWLKFGTRTKDPGGGELKIIYIADLYCNTEFLFLINRDGGLFQDRLIFECYFGTHISTSSNFLCLFTH